MSDQLKLDASDNNDDNDFNDNDRVTNHENDEERHIYDVNEDNDVKNEAMT